MFPFSSRYFLYIHSTYMRDSMMSIGKVTSSTGTNMSVPGHDFGAHDQNDIKLLHIIFKFTYFLKGFEIA